MKEKGQVKVLHVEGIERFGSVQVLVAAGRLVCGSGEVGPACTHLLSGMCSWDM